MNKIQYHDTILDLVGNTPLVSLQKIASPMLGQFFAKLEAFNPGHSAKDRTALYIINDAEKRGLLTPGGVIVETTSGNTGYSIAMIAAILAPQYPGGTVVTDSVTSDRLTDFLEKELRLKHMRYMRGYKNVINKCKELNAAGVCCPLAMETSGHGALKENYYLDDGAYLAVKLVCALANAKHSGKNICHNILV